MPINAQTTFSEPNKSEWTGYFYSRLGAIQTKLYNLALQGKIRAYRNDSLASTFSKEDLKYRGTYQNTVIEDRKGKKDDSGVIFFSPKDIKGIWFLQKTNNADFNIQQQASLLGIALIFQRSIYGVLMMPMPLLHVSISDLKTHLSTDEYDFMMKINHYCYNSNSRLVYPSFGDELTDEFFLTTCFTRTIL